MILADHMPARFDLWLDCVHRAPQRPPVTNTSHLRTSCCEPLIVFMVVACPCSLTLDLLNRTDPVLDVVRRRELVAPYGEHIERNRLEAPPGGLGAKQLAHGRSGRFATYDHSIARDHDVRDAPGQVRDARANLREHLRERLPG